MGELKFTATFGLDLPAIYGKQPLYFQDPVFIARAAVEAPEKSDVLTSKLSSEEEVIL